jgi:hypothetical protein
VKNVSSGSGGLTMNSQLPVCVTPGLRLANRPGSALRGAGRRLRRAGLIAAALALISPAAALASGFSVAIVNHPTHTPRIGSWQLRLYVHRGRERLGGDVNYVFLYDGQAVAHRNGHRFSNGTFNDTLRWPGEAVGHPLTLQIVVHTRYGTDRVNFWIRVRR